MKKTLFFLAVSILAAAWSSRTLSQELIVFIDDTAMSVKSHSEKGGYIYLTLQEGQIAIPKDRVREIRKLKSSRNDAPSQYIPPVPRNESGQESADKPAKDTGRDGFRKPMGRPPGIRKPASGEDEEEGEDEDDDSGDASGADEDDEGEEKESAAPAQQEPSQPRPGRPLVPEKFVKPVATSPVGRKH